jgi:hypothetical protein
MPRPTANGDDLPRARPTSSQIEDLLADLPADTVTLGWLVRRLGRRSFGLVLLLLGILALLPGINIAAGLLLIIPAMQMIRGRATPVFPRRIAARKLPARPLAALIRRVVPALRLAERVMRARHIRGPLARSQVTGVLALTLGVLVAATPIPLGNLPFAIGIILVAVAELEQDGFMIMLVLALLLSAVLALLALILRAVLM